MRSTFILTSSLVFLLGICNTASAVPHNHGRLHARSSSVVDATASGAPAPSAFAADPKLPVAKLAAAAKKAKDVGEKYPISHGSKISSTIFTDWAGFQTGAAYVWTADMDIDCDGIDYKCKGNTDGQSETSFGALAAYDVPFIVIPQSFVDKHSKELSGNNVMAVICDGKMYYGIFGDTDGDSPEVIGEASWLMGKTCFPTGNTDGGNGHGQADVTYIAFTGKDAVLPSSDMNKNYITNYPKLKSMGDEFVSQLASHLGI